MSGQGLPGLEVGTDPLERGDLVPESGIAGLRLRAHSLEPPLDVIAIRDEELEPERLQVGRRVSRTGEPVNDREQRVNLSQIPEQGRTRPGDVGQLERRRSGLRGAGRLCDRLQPLVGNRHGAERSVSTDERCEEHRAAGPRKPDDPDLEHRCLELTHAGVKPTRASRVKRLT